MADFTENFEKTVYFGSFFRWTPQGINHIREQFRANHPDPSNVPVVSYDTTNNAFSIKTSDRLNVRLFLKVLQVTIAYHQKQIDHTEEQFMIPIERTMVQDVISSNPELDSPPMGTPLIDIDQDSDESTEESSSGGVPCAYWVPRNGDISILSDHYASEIANLTDCVLYKEPDSRRVKIMNGQIHAAVAKLERLEPMLEHLYRHRDLATSTVDSNLLSFTSQLKGTGVRYQSIHANPTRHHDRIMVPQELNELLDQMLIGEERVCDQKTYKYTVPENLAPLDTTQPLSTEPCSVWNGFVIPLIGSKETAVPRTPSGGNSSASSNRRQGSIPAALQSSRYLRLQEQAGIREWSKNVDLDANPATVASAPLESETIIEEQPATKRAVDESDSDSDSPVRQGSKPVQPRMVNDDSDDESDLAALPPGTSMFQHHRALQSRNQPVDRAARRRGAPPPLVPVQSKSIPKRTVGADSFFDGIPRDEDEENQELQSPGIQFGGKENNANLPQKTRPVQTKIQSFSFDGTGDERSGNSPSHPSSIRRVGRDAENPEANPEAKPETLGRNFVTEQSTTGSQQTPVNSTANNEDDNESIHSYTQSSDFDGSRYGVTRRRGAPRNQAPPTSPRAGFKSREESGAAPWETVQTKKGGRHSRQRHSQNVHHVDSRLGSRPVPTLPNPGNAFGSRRQQANRSAPEQRQRQTDLIDCTDEEGTRAEALKPPPGLLPRTLHNNRASENDHILDGPLDEIQRPVMKPTFEGVMYQNEDTSFSASSSSGGIRPPGIHYIPQTQIIKPDILEMRQSMMQQLISVKSRGTTSKETTDLDQCERIEENDEMSSRRYHQTMNLQANNPGNSKAKKNLPAESAAQQKARIAKVKEDLIKGSSNAKQNSSSESLSTSSQKPAVSKRALQAARNNAEMASLHSDVTQDDARKTLSTEFVQAMKPLLEAAQCFSGELHLQMQIGQLLTLPSPRIETKKVLEAGKWSSIFARDTSSVDVKFSNMLTNHGPDIDGILEFKTKKWKTWKKDQPGPASVVIEFQCLDNLAQPFKVVLHTDGSHKITKGKVAIGKIAVHCPGRIWDTCAVVVGTEPWYDIPVALQDDTQEFISTVYVSGGAKTTVSFRPPSSNCFTIQNVVLERQSLHDCQVPSEESLQLQVIEIKTLSIRSHRADKRLHLAVESDHVKMADDGHLHYEVCIVHKEINKAFEENLQLEIGEKTFAMAYSMFTRERASSLLNSALRLVDKMDWVGGRNYGTLVQLHDQMERRRQDLARTLPPGRNPTLIRPVNINSSYSVMMPRMSMMPGSTVDGGYTNSQALPIHGIRSGTAAQVYKDPSDGSKFYIGQGGARIPLVAREGNTIGRSEIVPDDSASQIGRPVRRVPKAMGALPEKPESFW